MWCLPIISVLLLINSSATALPINNLRIPAGRDATIQARARITSSCNEAYGNAILTGMAGVEYISDVARQAVFTRGRVTDRRLIHHFGASGNRVYEAAQYHFTGLYADAAFTYPGSQYPPYWTQTPIWCRDLQNRCGSRTAAYVIDGASDPSRTGFVICPAFLDLPDFNPSDDFAEDRVSALMRMLLSTSKWLDSPLESLWVGRHNYRPSTVVTATRVQRTSTYIVFAKDLFKDFLDYVLRRQRAAEIRPAQSSSQRP